MESSTPLPPVDPFDISTRGRVRAGSSWHEAQRRVDALGLRRRPPVAGAWSSLVATFGGSSDLSRRRFEELRPIVDAANRIIDALNALQPGEGYDALMRRLVVEPVAPPEPLRDLLGDAMQRIRQHLQSRVP